MATSKIESARGEVETVDRAFEGLSALSALPFWDGTSFTPLEVPRQLLSLLGNPQDSFKSVHVGGTNGKGSVSTFIASMLFAAQNHVGQFTSPHLSHVTERCLYDGAPQSIEAFDSALRDVLEVAKAHELRLSYFVLSAVACFLEFARTKVDWGVIEVGLGGTYDATNVLAHPAVTVITGVDFDHMHILGETLEEIAENKAGIIKPNIPVVLGEMPEKAKAVIVRVAGEMKAPLFSMGEEFRFDSARSALRTNELELSLPAVARIPAESYQRHNATLAARVGILLGLNADAINQGIAAARWPGRLELVEKDAVSILLDSAHNPQGIRSLCRYLDAEVVPRVQSRIIFMLGVLERKNWMQMCSILGDWQRKLVTRNVEVSWVFTEPDNEQALDVERLVDLFDGGIGIPSPAEALDQAMYMAKDDGVLVLAGSIFLIGSVRPLLTSEPFRTF